MVGENRVCFDLMQNRKADFISNRLQVLDRLTSESVELLGTLGAHLQEVGSITSPIHSRTTALTGAQRNIAAAKQAVDELLEHLETSRRVQGVLEAGPGQDLDVFLDALSQLEHSNMLLQQYSSLSAVSQALTHSQKVFNRALEQCDTDFRTTLAISSRSCAPSLSWLRSNLDVQITDTNRGDLTRDLVPESVLPKMQRMVEIMLEAGYGIAQQGYIAQRDRELSQVLRELGVDAQQQLATASALAAMGSESLDRVIINWCRQLRALTLLLLSERQLALSVWPPGLSQEVLAGLAASHLNNMVRAGYAITEAIKAPDKIFLMLDMHKSLQASLPVLQDLLVGAADRLLGDIQMLLQRVRTSAACLFGEYQDHVARDANKVIPMDGTIHPLTAQVLSYLKRLLTYDNAAEVCGSMFPSAQVDDQPGSSAEEDGSSSSRQPGSAAATTALATGVGRLLMNLLSNLEVKSQSYKNDAIAALFMMNNVHYVQWSVESSPAALQLLGVEWLERHKDAVEDWGAKYHDITWMPLVNMLKADPPSDISRVKLMLKDTFSAFNAAIDRIYTHQSGWTIPDHILRSAVKRVIKDDLLDTYQQFMRKYVDVQFTNNPAKYIKYAVTDVASIIDDDLFETKAVSMNKLSLTKEKLGAIV